MVDIFWYILFLALSTKTNRKNLKKYYDEENGIGTLGPDGGIDGIFDFP